MKPKIHKAELVARCFFCKEVQQVQYYYRDTNKYTHTSFAFKNYNYDGTKIRNTFVLSR